MRKKFISLLIAILALGVAYAPFVFELGGATLSPQYAYATPQSCGDDYGCQSGEHCDRGSQTCVPGGGRSTQCERILDCASGYSCDLNGDRTCKPLAEISDDPNSGGNIGGNNSSGGNIAGNNSSGGNIGGNNSSGGNIGGNNSSGGNIGGNNSNQPPAPVIDHNCGVTKLCNPLLPQYGTLCQVLLAIVRLLTQLGAIIAVLMFIWTGFKFVTAQGNTAKLSDAKKAFYTTIIGTAVLLGASAITQIVIQTVFTITNQGNSGLCSI